jgi:plasmid stabilization system protein ParE
VPEFGREDIRELLKGNYRIIYRAAEYRVEILTIYHSARMVDESDI